MKFSNFKENLLAFCFRLILVLGLLELVFTFIIPASDSPNNVYDDTNHITNFEPNTRRVL